MSSNQEEFFREKPKYCPSCAASLIDCVPFTRTDEGGGFDVYCYQCSWSGDIMPDELSEVTTNWTIKQ